MARCACSMPPASAIVAAVLCAHSARKPVPPAHRAHAARCAGHGLPHLHRPLNCCPSSQCLLARCCGAIGSAVISGDTGSLCCAHKPYCSPLAQLSMGWERRFPDRMCLPVPNEPTGGSVGSNVSLAMLALLPPHPLRSPFMVSRSALLTSLALMWLWPRNSSKTPLAAFFSDRFCSVCLH